MSSPPTTMSPAGEMFYDDGRPSSTSSPSSPKVNIKPESDNTAPVAQDVVTAASSAGPWWDAHYDSNGKWTGSFEQCPKRCQGQIGTQIRNELWSRGDFPGVRFSKEYPLQEEVAKEYMAWHHLARQAQRFKWFGRYKKLLEMGKEDQKPAIPVKVQRRWEQNEEVQETDLPKDFRIISSAKKYIVIEMLKQPKTIVAFRIPVPPEFIAISAKQVPFCQNDPLFPHNLGIIVAVTMHY